MNRQQRRAAQRRRRDDDENGEFQFIDNFNIPLDEFAAMFELTEDEIREEGNSARLIGAGNLTSRGWAGIRIKESSAQAWLASDLPAAVRAKVDAAGGFAKLEEWRRRFIMGCKVDFENNTLTLPDGTRYTNVQVKAKLPQ